MTARQAKKVLLKQGLYDSTVHWGVDVVGHHYRDSTFMRAIRRGRQFDWLCGPQNKVTPI